MTAAESPVGSAETSYIRAGGGVSVDRRRLWQILAAVATVALAGSAIGLGLSASAQNDQREKLAHHGVAVQATVTGCIALGSGVGEGITGYTCSGYYRLDGRRYQAVIHGPDTNRAVGSVVAAVAVPGEPSLLTAAGSVAGPRGWWASYLVTAILAVLAAVSAVTAVQIGRRSVPA